LRPPLLLQLPVELLSAIFQAYFPAHRRDQWISKAPLLLGSIGSAWRAVAWLMPHLWSTIALTVHNGAYPRDKCTLFRDWLSRTGEQPLSLTFKHSSATSRLLNSQETQEAIWDTFDLCFTRWETVHLRMDWTLEEIGFFLTEDFPQLKTLRLSGGFSETSFLANDPKVFRSALQLREVHLSRIQDPLIAVFNLPQIPNMRLILKGTDVHTSLQVLHHRSNFVLF
jgi:hypothetical protein